MLSLTCDVSNSNMLANFPNLDVLLLFQVLTCQIWAPALAFPQEMYRSSASAFSQARLSISSMLLQLAVKLDGTREE